MSAHELWYDAPAKDWLEALPLGNGRLGAMVFGRPGRELVLLNDSTAWSGSPRSEHAHGRVSARDAADAMAGARAALLADDHETAIAQVQRLQSRYTQSYLPLGRLTIDSRPSGWDGAASAEAWAHPPFLTDYVRRLDLRTAEHETRYRLGGAPVLWRVVASHPDGVLQVRLESEEPCDLDVELGSELRVVEAARGAGLAHLTLRMPSDVPPPFEPSEHIAYSDEPGDALSGALVAGWQHDGTEVSAGDDTAVLSARGVTRCTLTVATQTTFDGIGRAPLSDVRTARARACARVRRALALGAPAVTARQRADHAALYDRVELELPGPAGDPDGGPPSRPTDRLISAESPGPLLDATVFHYGRYLLICSSRDGGTPANLQGIWNPHLQPPWSSNYTVNINTQMSYWAAETANLAETLHPLVELIEALSVSGAETARRLYGARGWVGHHNSDVWAYSSPVGMGRADPAWAFWPLAGAWLCLHLRDRVRFGAGDGFARDTAWPVIRSASEFYLDWLVELPEGLGTVPSTSPENHFVTPHGTVSGLGVSSTMDLALIAALFDALEELAVRLGRREDLVAARARLVRPRIPGPRVGSGGLVREWAADPPPAERGHRHLSHLAFAHPGDSILDGELREALSRSLDDRGDDSTGWSLAWKLNLRARLGQSGKVSDLLALFRRTAPEDDAAQQGGLYPNLFAAHPPFQIDGNFGFVAGVVEALLHSHAGFIELLPAVPDDWPTGSVRGLVARPGVVVDIRWEPDATGRPALASARLHALREDARRSVTVVYRGAGRTVDLTSGAEVHLRPEAFVPSAEKGPV
jgi:alpha-L-fucosidase 2